MLVWSRVPAARRMFLEGGICRDRLVNAAAEPCISIALRLNPVQPISKGVEQAVGVSVAATAPGSGPWVGGRVGSSRGLVVGLLVGAGGALSGMPTCVNRSCPAPTATRGSTSSDSSSGSLESSPHPGRLRAGDASPLTERALLLLRHLSAEPNFLHRMGILVLGLQQPEAVLRLRSRLAWVRTTGQQLDGSIALVPLGALVFRRLLLLGFLCRRPRCRHRFQTRPSLSRRGVSVSRAGPFSPRPR